MQIKLWGTTVNYILFHRPARKPWLHNVIHGILFVASRPPIRILVFWMKPNKMAEEGFSIGCSCRCVAGSLLFLLWPSPRSVILFWEGLVGIRADHVPTNVCTILLADHFWPILVAKNERPRRTGSFQIFAKFLQSSCKRSCFQRGCVSVS